MNFAGSNLAKSRKLDDSKGAETVKRRMLEKIAAVACAVCLAIGVMSGVVFARDEEEVPQEVPAPQATFVVVDPASEEAGQPTGEIVDNRNTVPFLVNGDQIATSMLVEGVPYVCAAELFAALGVKDAALVAEEGQNYFSCNGRYFYVADGVQVMGGEVWLPVEELAECLGVSAVWDQVLWTISMNAEGYTLPERGALRYDPNDLYWLSRIIYAEAGDQSMKGQIAVGNVVLNRLASGGFAEQNTVYDVIFAKNQFDVVVNGMIYMEPGEEAVVAAKLALEGYDVCAGATCFHDKELGEGYECTAWIDDRCFMTEA